MQMFPLLGITWEYASAAMQQFHPKTFKPTKGAPSVAQGCGKVSVNCLIRDPSEDEVEGKYYQIKVLLHNKYHCSQILYHMQFSSPITNFFFV
jgi:hypothetical protein